MSDTLKEVNKLIHQLDYSELEVLISVMIRKQRHIKESLESALKNEVI